VAGISGIRINVSKSFNMVILNAFSYPKNSMLGHQ